MSNHPISRRPLLLGSGAAAFLTLLPFKALAAGPAQSPLPAYKVAQIDDGIYIVGEH